MLLDNVVEQAKGELNGPGSKDKAGKRRNCYQDPLHRIRNWNHEKLIEASIYAQMASPVFVIIVTGSVFGIIM